MSDVYYEGSAKCAHKWFNFHDGSDRVCEKCKRHELRPDSDSALLIAANARISALEGLLRECEPVVLDAAQMNVCHAQMSAAKRQYALLSRLDAALTPDRKDQDGR